MVNFIKKQSLDYVPVVSPSNSAEKPEAWLSNSRSACERLLHDYGAVLLRGFDIHALSEFNRFALAYSPNLLEYTNRSTPRTKLGGHVYTSTEYPKERVIPQHSENSYTNHWPSALLFFSVLVAETGGETPLARTDHILQQLDKSLVERFERHNLLYVRNYHPHIDLSWQEVFQTEEKSEVEQFCHNNHIEYEWLKDGQQLRTRQCVQSTIVHPKTGEKVWFNQANLFHASAIGEQDNALLIEALGEENLPRQVYFGNGEPISPDDIAEINRVIEAEKCAFPWQKSDLLIVDNLLMTHGRHAYTGNRKVVVAMVA
ncbi:MAG: TauD/TfdA family dioxygenase [Pseudomonadota bacterium]